MTPSLKRNLWIVGFIVFAVLLIDQIIKVWVKTSFTEQLSNGRLNYNRDEISLIGDWFKLLYIENQGMAFGTTFGASIWAKLGLSIFRIIAIIGIGYYWWKQAKRGARTGMLIAIGFIFAGATGNLIDSMFYDFIFPYDGCLSFNHLEGSGVYSDCPPFGKLETRHTGFLLGNVVDMFRFDMFWPEWMPLVGGSEVFPAIWNIADGSITVGVVIMVLRQRSFFGTKEAEEKAIAEELKSLRQIGFLGGLFVLLMLILLAAKVIAIPAGYETGGFYAFVIVYILSLYVVGRLCDLQGRSKFMWVIVTLVCPLLPAIVLARLPRKPAVASVRTEEREETPLSE